MSRRRENWVKLPLQQAPAWYRLSLFQSALGAKLFSLYQEREVDLGEDWMGALCKAMGASGTERPAAKKALKAIHDAGLIVINGDLFRLIYSEAAFDAEKLRAKQDPPTDEPRSNRDQVEAEPRSNPGLTETRAKPPKSIGLEYQRERERERSPLKPPVGAERDEPKTVPVQDPDWFSVDTVERLFSAERKAAGKGPCRIAHRDYERATTAVAVLQDEPDPELAARRSMRSYFRHADGLAREKGFPFWGWAMDVGSWLARADDDRRRQGEHVQGPTYEPTDVAPEEAADLGRRIAAKLRGPRGNR